MIYEDLTLENYNLVYNSCLFEEEWYLKTYCGNDKSINPIFHYLIEGVELNYNPNPLFDTEFYLTKNYDVKNAGMNPLLHYILYGKREGRLFSDTFQLKELSLEEELFYKNPQRDIIVLEGVKKIIEFNLFDEEFYLNEYHEVKESNVNPLIHYLKIGANEDKNPSKIFNTSFYKSNFPEIKESNINPLIHYAVYCDKNNGITKINELNNFRSLSENNKFEYLNKKIKTLENQYKQELGKHEQILDYYHDYFNFIFLNTNITPYGIHRNTQLQTFEMLKFIVNLCEKNNITYWLDFGTLIGALRHQGFVPWDDEADIVIPRPDFEKFINILIDVVNNNPNLKERVDLQIAWRSFRESKSLNSFPSPCIQFVDKVPLANVDIQIMDYYDLNAMNSKPLLENEDFFYRIRRDFAVNVMKGAYEDVEEAFFKQSQKVGISFEETEFLGSSLDFEFRIPMRIDKIFPLQKVIFEGIEFNAPKDPYYYLSAVTYYKVHNEDDVNKVPRSIHNHNRTVTVPNQLPGKDINKEFEKTLAFWRYINSIY